jgi:hypothetical protein
MPSRRWLLAAFVLFPLSGAAVAAEQSAHDFVAGIYATYEGKDSKGVALDTRAKIARYFTPSLTKLMDDDRRAAAKRHEVGALDGDPFVDAQDWEVSDVAVDVKEDGNKAVATVKFKIFKEDRTVVLDLLKLKQGWRIDEIHMPTGSLRAVFKKK